MNTERNLDGQIKQALENLQAKYDGLSWEAFEQRLDQADSDAQANGNDVANGSKMSFDEVISGKLDRIEVPIVAGDWSLMEKMIEADETAEVLENEAVVDNLLTERLENFQVAYQPHHWQMMANRLEVEFFVRYHILRCKAAEAALVVLMLLTIARFLPTSSESPAQIEPSKNANWPTAPAAPAPSKKAGSTLDVPIAQAQAKNSPQFPSANGPMAVTIRAPRFLASNAAETGNGKNSTGVSAAGLNLAFLPPSTLHRPTSDRLPKNLFEAITEKRFLWSRLTTPGLDNRNSLMLASLDATAEKQRYAWEVPQLPQSYFLEKNWTLRMSAFTNTDFAMVLMPPTKYSMYDTLIAEGYDTTLASGYGGGIAVHFKKHKWEIQTGATYSVKRYVPNSPALFAETVNYIIKQEESEFKGVQLNILQVPLHLNYHFKDHGKWRIYGSFGAAGHLVTTSTNQAKELAAPTSATFALLPPVSNVSSKIVQSKGGDIVEQQPVSAANQPISLFPNGFFEGGHIRNNFYLTANIGLGLERYVSSRWSIFLQPNYQHQFLKNDIGVNGERFYNFSLQFGTKVGLK
jgi:hypothetical protein